MMENKLQQLTEKLRMEGLEKGRAQSDEMIGQAKEQVDKMLGEARAAADKIVADAKQAAEELTRNTANEVRLASLQTLSALRAKIERMVVAALVEPKVSAAWADASFVKGLIVEAVRTWSPSSENTVKILVPEGAKADVEGAIAGLFTGGVEVVCDGKVRVPFRIAPGEGGYYVSFSDEDFATLIKASLRPVVTNLIYGK